MRTIVLLKEQSSSSFSSLGLRFRLLGILEENGCCVMWTSSQFAKPTFNLAHVLVKSWIDEKLRWVCSVSLRCSKNSEYQESGSKFKKIIGMCTNRSLSSELIVFYYLQSACAHPHLSNSQTIHRHNPSLYFHRALPEGSTFPAIWDIPTATRPMTSASGKTSGKLPALVFNVCPCASCIVNPVKRPIESWLSSNRRTTSGINVSQSIRNLRKSLQAGALFHMLVNQAARARNPIDVTPTRPNNQSPLNQILMKACLDRRNRLVGMICRIDATVLHAPLHVMLDIYWEFFPWNNLEKTTPNVILQSVLQICIICGLSFTKSDTPSPCYRKPNEIFITWFEDYVSTVFRRLHQLRRASPSHKDPAPYCHLSRPIGFRHCRIPGGIPNAAVIDSNSCQNVSHWCQTLILPLLRKLFASSPFHSIPSGTRHAPILPIWCFWSLIFGHASSCASTHHCHICWLCLKVEHTPFSMRSSTNLQLFLHFPSRWTCLSVLTNRPTIIRHYSSHGRHVNMRNDGRYRRRASLVPSCAATSCRERSCTSRGKKAISCNHLPRKG